MDNDDYNAGDASTVDSGHYPDPSEGSASQLAAPTHAEISARAHQLWLDEGRPDDSAARHWLEAERELHAAANANEPIETVHDRAGSAQA